MLGNSVRQARYTGCQKALEEGYIIAMSILLYITATCLGLLPGYSAWLGLSPSGLGKTDLAREPYLAPNTGAPLPFSA